MQKLRLKPRLSGARGCAALAATALLIVAPPPSRAADPPPAIEACRAESDAMRRLRCYDRVVDEGAAAHSHATEPNPPAAAAAASHAAPAAPVTPTAAALPPSAVATVPPSAVAPSAVAQSAVAQVAVAQSAAAAPAAASGAPAMAAHAPMFTARITALRLRRHGEFVVTLDNGTIWTQYVAQGRAPLGVGDAVTLRPGLFGAYILVASRDLAASREWNTKVRQIADAALDK